MADHDYPQRFPFENPPIRGEFAQLDAAWRTVLERRAYPSAVGRVLREAELRRAPAERDTRRANREFCSHRYIFDPIDVAGLFAANVPDVSATRH